MFVPSSLPNFEIPTGLMASGLQGLRGFGRGLGSVNVQALAQAMKAGLRGSFVPTSYDQFPGVDAGPSNFTSYCLDDATSASIAAALGGRVVKLPVESLEATNGPVPACNWIQTADGIIRAADVYAIASQGCYIDGLTPLCCLEQQLANNIPGGQMDSSCTYAPGTSNPYMGGSPAIVPVAPVYVPPIKPVGTTPPIKVLPEPVQTPATLSPIPSSGGPTSPTVQQTVSPATPQPGLVQGSQPPAQQQTPATSGDNTTLYIGLGIAALAALFLFGGSK